MRLTEKIFINNKFCGYGFKRNHQERVVNRTSTNDTTNTTEIIHKLGQLEDIEDELGIDLITLFKALKNGIYVKTKNGISKQYTIHLMKWQQTNTYCLYYRPYSHIWFKDYGKTWSLVKEDLTKEELE